MAAGAAYLVVETLAGSHGFVRAIAGTVRRADHATGRLGSTARGVVGAMAGNDNAAPVERIAVLHAARQTARGPDRRCARNARTPVGRPPSRCCPRHDSILCRSGIRIDAEPGFPPAVARAEACRRDVDVAP